MLGSLGSTPQKEVWNEATQVYLYVKGDQSVLILLYGVATVLLSVLMFLVWRGTLRSAYKAECLAKEGKHINTFAEDLKSLLHENLHRLLMTPPMVFICGFTILPLIFMICMAFTNYSKIDNHLMLFDWVGLENFRYFFQSGKAWSTTRNTILYNIAFLLINTFLEILCAILLSELAGKWFKRITQSVMFLPYFISWVVVGAFLYNLLNYEFGAVNTFLRQLGREPVDVYSNKMVWPLILIAASAFKTVGYGTVMYLASIMNIDGQLFEAADLDGANMWQKIRYITLPCIRPTVVILFLLAIGTIMKGDFQMFWQVTGNNPMVLDVTDVIDTYVTRSLLNLQEFGMTSAAGLYQSVFSFILVLIANRIVKKAEPDYALF